jgi:G3E family GTPase
MIELTLVSGYLGAGKTTWLESRLRDDPAGVDVLVVNDFADEGVDHLLLAPAVGSDAVVEVITGGCVCCERLDDLSAVLLRLVGRRHRRSMLRDRPRVIIETSGLADPRNIAQLLTDDPVLRTNVVLQTLVVVLDGVDGLRLLRHREQVRAQLAIADRVVLARADLADPDTLGRLAGTVRLLNESAEITASAYGHEEAVTSRAPASPHDFDDEAAGNGPVRSWSVALEPGTSWAEYAVWLDAVCRAHPRGLLRSKGIVPTPDGPLLVQSMGPGVAVPAAAEESGGSPMVFILSGIAPATLARSLRTFVPSAFASDVPDAAQ